MQRLTIANNVRCTLFNGAASGDASITVSDAVAPFNNPPSPGGFPGLVTLTDSLVAPTRFEIITYTGVTVNGNGTRTLTGCLRGRDGTTAQAWSAGAVVYCAPTRLLLNPNNVALTDQSNSFIESLAARQVVRHGLGVSPVIALAGGQSASLDVSLYHTFLVAITNFEPFPDPQIYLTPTGMSPDEVVDATIIVAGQQTDLENAVFVGVNVYGFAWTITVAPEATELRTFRFFNRYPQDSAVILGQRSYAGDPFGFHPDTPPGHP